MNRKYALIALLTPFFSSYGMEMATLNPTNSKRLEISSDLLNPMQENLEQEKNLEQERIRTKMSIRSMVHPSFDIPIYCNPFNKEKAWVLCPIPGCRTGVLTTARKIKILEDNVKMHMRNIHPNSSLIPNYWFRIHHSKFLLAPQGVIKKRRNTRNIREKNKSERDLSF